MLVKILTASHSNKPTLTDKQVSEGFAIWDITVKSGDDCAWWLAPTWEMVNKYKSGDLSTEEFSNLYFLLVEKRWKKLSLLKEFLIPSKLILVCYCKSGEFCHRLLAAEFLSNKYIATYFGEYNKS